MRRAALLLPFDAPLVRPALAPVLAPSAPPAAKVDVRRLFDQTESRRAALLASVRHEYGCLRLDAVLLLCLTLESDKSWKFLRLVVPTYGEFYDYPRRMLARCRVALKPFYGDLTARIEQDRGLRFAWRQGKGGLILRSDPCSKLDGVTLTLVLPQVKP
jgi:hypothetical protein